LFSSNSCCSAFGQNLQKVPSDVSEHLCNLLSFFQIMRIFSISLVCSLCCFLPRTNSLNIVSIGTLATTSHFIWKNALLNELLTRGHKITELTFKVPTPHPNRTSFVLESGLFPDEKFMSFINDAKEDKHFLRGIYGLFSFNIEAFRGNLASKAFQVSQLQVIAFK